MTPKIATCCYCGSRAALVVDRARHELSCASCGAPLHHLKNLPVDPDRREHESAPVQRYHKRKSYPAASLPYWAKKKSKRRRKSLLSRALEEAFDVIEEIFD